jgi:hypothetical protein
MVSPNERKCYPMFCTDEMKKVLESHGYKVYFYNGGTECDVFMGGHLLHTFEGEYSLYNWMCDCELL